MSDEYAPAYGELQSEPDNIEVIRDQIAALLVLDLQKQKELAADAGDPNAADYDVAVYVENDDPLQYVDDETPESNPFPCVNVSLDSSEPDRGTASANKMAMTAQFFIDCYATGNTESTEDFGTKAALKAWKTARLVRRILRSEADNYLRLRGVVGKVGFKFQAGEPNGAQSAIRVKMVRITLSVDYVEDVEISQSVIDWEIAGIITDENGQVIFGEKQGD